MVLPLACPDLADEDYGSVSSFWTGKELDPDFVAFFSQNARYHFPARFYLPNRGAFGSIDALVLWEEQISELKVQFWNFASRWNIQIAEKYSYVEGNPVMLSDATGLTVSVAPGDQAVVGSWVAALCPESKWQFVNGELQPVDTHFCKPRSGYRVEKRCTGDVGIGFTALRECERTKKPKSCCCLCDAIAKGGKAVTITKAYSPVGGHLNPETMTILITGVDKPLPAARGGNVMTPPFMILGHELCTHYANNFPHSEPPLPDKSIEMENQIRAEHGHPLRHPDYRRVSD